jgi:hypothetical protein
MSVTAMRARRRVARPGTCSSTYDAISVGATDHASGTPEYVAGFENGKPLEWRPGGPARTPSTQ